MDEIYLQFLLCQCVLNRADWGLTIGCINVMYSFILFNFWGVELARTLHDYPVKWMVLYGFNIMFNIITMMRIVKRESISVFYWFCETAALLLFRLYFTYAQADCFWLTDNQLFFALNLGVDVYIFLSLLVMIYVMWGLHLEQARQFPKEQMRNDYKYDPEAAAAKKAAEEKNDRLERQRKRELEKEKQLEKDKFNEEIEMETVFTNDCGHEEEQAYDPSAPEESNLYSVAISEHKVEHLRAPTAPNESTLFMGDYAWNRFFEIYFGG
ncbi:uncharacterized protein [Drosophila pseudoobscura]|uniref:Uncharacterized protein n=1 Tax=Drosophila pseudoobscura pseudoobscura TaxID=46245 RepID=A0A6I8V4G6_DROPS|nr:uncharacterized protein LOC6898354 [Drosophila pseudoobscura]